MSADRGIAYLDKLVAEKKKRTFPTVWLAEAAMPESSPAIVKGLIEPKTLGVIYGESASGKTFFAIDMVFHIVQGMPWRGRKVQKVLVVYVAAEAGVSILKRFLALRDHKLGEVAEPGPLAILTRGPNLLDQLDVEVLIEQLLDIGRKAGMPLGLVVFDTLSRSIPGGDENSAESMTTLIEVADRLRDELGATTLMIHHTGKDPSKGARGHSALFSAADVVMSVANKSARVEKVRDGVAGEEFPFELELVEMGLDQDGEPITTCVVKHEADGARQRLKAEPRGANQKVVLGVLRGLEAEPLPATSAIPKGVRGVRFEKLVERAASKFPGLAAWRAKDRVGQAVTSLQAAGLVGVHDEWIWLW